MDEAGGLEYYAPNPHGKNQYPDCPLSTDEEVAAILRAIHRTTTNRDQASRILKDKYDISMKGRTVGRRWALLGCKAAGATSKNTSEIVLTQLVLDELAEDRSKQSGPKGIKDEVARKTGFHVKRDFVKDVMFDFEPEGFDLRDPTSDVLVRKPLTSKGPHHEWCGDGHDKLVIYGFAIWGLRDKFSRYWLGLWVIPNNRLGTVVAYLWLSVVYEVGGIPEQTTTDCGSENTIVYGLGLALRNAFAPELNDGHSPAHRFLKSVHNIGIERGWLDLRHRWGHNIPLYWEDGAGVYDQLNPLHYNLALWLWPPLLQESLDDVRDRMNTRKTRKDKKKRLPSGVSPETAFRNWREHGGEEFCLHPVDREVVKEIMDALNSEGDIFDWGVPTEMAEKFLAAYQELNIGELTLHNVWDVFKAILLKLE